MYRYRSSSLPQQIPHMQHFPSFQYQPVEIYVYYVHATNTLKSVGIAIFHLITYQKNTTMYIKTYTNWWVVQL